MKPSLLFVSPAIPSPTGGGTAMRAWHVLHALASVYDVRLLAGSRYFPCSFGELSDVVIPVSRRCVIPMNPLRDPVLLLSRIAERCLPGRFCAPSGKPADWLPLTPSVRRTLERFIAHDPVDVVHIFRLYMMPVMEALRPLLPRARYQLDLDDIESDTRLRLSERYRAVGRVRMAERLARDSRWCRHVEDEAGARFDRVWVCSRTDRDRLATRQGGERLRIVPNTALPPDAVPAFLPRPFTFLFVGSLHFFPNRDAVEWMCRDVIPALRCRAPAPFSVRIVGHAGADDMARWKAMAPEADVRGFSPEIAGHYADAHAVVVPLRAGGGTRIKILEAFGYGRPVVATPAAVEGLEVEDGKHVLLGNDADALAERCARLMADPALGAELGHRARTLFDRSYAPPIMWRSVISATAV